MKHPPNHRLGWFRFYVNRFNRLKREDSAHMALFYFQLVTIEDGHELELA